MSSFRRNVTAVYIANAVNGVVGLALVPLSIAVMGKSAYGLFSIYTVLYSYVTLIESGLTKNLVRLLASDRSIEARTRYLRTALGFYTGVSILLIGLLPVLTRVVPSIFDLPEETLRIAQWIVAITVIEYIITIPTATLQWYGTADEKFGAISRFNIMSGLYRYALMYAGLLIFRRPEVVVALSASRRLIDLFVIPRVVGKLPAGAWRPTFKIGELKTMFAHSVPLTVAQVGVTSLYAAPAVLVSRIFGLEALGAYRAIYDLGNRVWFFSTGFGAVVFPKLVRMFSSRISNLQRQTIYAAFYFSWAAYLVMAFAGVALAPVIVTFLHLSVPEYFVVWALVFIGICMSAHAELAYELLQATRRYRALLMWTLSAIALMIGATVAAARLGLVAVGFGWLVSLLVYTSFMDAASLIVIGATRARQFELLLAKVAYLIAAGGVVLTGWISGAVSAVAVAGAMLFIGALQIYSVALYRRLRTYSTVPVIAATGDGSVVFDTLGYPGEESAQ